jgi:hypothetical protein
MKFGYNDPCYTLLQGKIDFYERRIRILNTTQKNSD